MANTALAAIQKRTASLASLGTTDLASQEKVEALVKTAVDVNEQAKAYKAEDERVKSEFKRMCAPYIDEGKSVTCYAFDQGMKMTLSYSGGGISVSEDALLRQLYESYGETYGDKNGKAWAAFLAVTDPIEIPRKINEDRLAHELARAQRIGAGIEDGVVLVTPEIVAPAVSEKKPSVVAKCSKMTKAEVKAHNEGALTEVLAIS